MILPPPGDTGPSPEVSRIASPCGGGEWQTWGHDKYNFHNIFQTNHYLQTIFREKARDWENTTSIIL